MFCNKCGRRIEKEEKICPECGAKVEKTEYCGGFWGLVNEKPGPVLQEPKEESTERQPKEEPNSQHQKWEREKLELHTKMLQNIIRDTGKTGREKRRTDFFLLVIGILAVVIIGMQAVQIVQLKKECKSVDQVQQEVTELEKKLDTLSSQNETLLGRIEELSQDMTKEDTSEENESDDETYRRQEIEQNRTEESQTEQSQLEQNQFEQSQTEQSPMEQNQTEQSENSLEYNSGNLINRNALGDAKEGVE